MKKALFTFVLILSLSGLYLIWGNRPNSEHASLGASTSKKITFSDGGLRFEFQETEARTVADFLREKKITVDKKDFITPERDSVINSGSIIILERSKEVEITVDGESRKVNTVLKTIADVLIEKEINLSEDDIVKPNINLPLKNGEKIQIIRVNISEEKVRKDIPFTTKENKDDKLSWRIKKVTHRGEKGVKEITYKVISHNGKEISRQIIREETLKEPITEVVTQGTLVKTGKSHNGMASWYAHRGGLYAANPWLPMGSFVRVTNKENGRQVIVQINDRGPFGNGRIIDLDKVAFAKIANLGQGVINVKMEEIVN